MSLNKNIALSDSGFIFNPTNGDSFSTNTVGLGIIKLLKDGKSKNEILTILSDLYDVATDSLEKDFNDFMSVLQNYQLLVIHE